MHMKKILAVLIAAAVLAVASPAVMTQASENETPISAAADTIVFAAGGPDHPGSEGEAWCTDEDASTVTSIGAGGLRDNTYCTTGAHDPAIYSITHGPDLNAISPDFTGVVESIIQYDGGERRWACSFSTGTWTGCQGAGAWPGQATEFCHDVWAYETQGDVSQPILTGFAPACPNGADPIGLGLGANTQPHGDGQPEGSWAAYVIHG